MSFHFGQVLGSGAAKPDPKKEPKIVQSDLQRRRALQKTRSSKTFSTATSSSSYIHSKLPIASQGGQLISGDQSEVFHRKLDVPPLSSTSPLALASQCVQSSIDKDNNVPPLNEVQSKLPIDSYNYKADQSLGPFSRFEKAGDYPIPDRIFQENQSLNCVSNMGILAEIEKAWLAIENNQAKTKGFRA
ncbi:unnamed protein product [Ambrosiozyma monospora]|uniref:Unnamed protein product n=1 Tax=Ambrosiozyma monospora TaxID=43982 RepID=A0ACB5TYS0_AMBMO|nr:unnamed protein product [Ambrosiozyma monospora]